MKTTTIIPLLMIGAVALYIYQAKSDDDENLRDDPKFRKGFAAGFSLHPGVFFFWREVFFTFTNKILCYSKCVITPKLFP